ncbi:hypothetical protein [Actinomadura montaniterrae]|uniref:Uncharacterized protein n=1 Tax=Actinomadura montaniterrae TaxID=1803903 RepID=A0A6L3VHF7_9ACTN|nr:hypothetical protein [Actinomadura montaniterrae]KAB2363415.1 hypothetical protein F9B16_43045 [Actinomadura montaniterrae]
MIMRRVWRLAWMGWGCVAAGTVFGLASVCYLYFAGLAAAAGLAGGGALLVCASRRKGLRAVGLAIAGLLVMAILLPLPGLLSRVG